jgi:hypothetical protein
VWLVEVVGSDQRDVDVARAKGRELTSRLHPGERQLDLGMAGGEEAQRLGDQPHVRAAEPGDAQAAALHAREGFQLG